jgi:hypothetical protein
MSAGVEPWPASLRAGAANNDDWAGRVVRAVLADLAAEALSTCVTHGHDRALRMVHHLAAEAVVIDGREAA